MRRIVEKVVIGHLHYDLMEAAGPLHTSAGLKLGIEASIHEMRSIFERDNTQGLLFVDVENAFNNQKRKVALHNIKQLCPSFFRFLSNTYQVPAMMIINYQVKDSILHVQEGNTQCCVTAIGIYAIAILIATY